MVAEVTDVVVILLAAFALRYQIKPPMAARPPTEPPTAPPMMAPLAPPEVVLGSEIVPAEPAGGGAGGAEFDVLEEDEEDEEDAPGGGGDATDGVHVSAVGMHVDVSVKLPLTHFVCPQAL